MLRQRIKKETRNRVEERKECPVCGKVFWGLKVKKLCSRACRDKLYTQRHPEEVRARMRAAYARRKSGKGR